VIAVALLLALGSAAALNWSYLIQHGEAAAMPPLTLRHPVRSLRLLFSNRRWLIGFFAGITGWVLYVAALALAPLSLVQAVAAGGIGLLALFVWRLTGVELTRREWLGVAIAVAGLALLALSLGGGHDHGSHGDWMTIAVWLACSAALACLVTAARGLAPGAGLGAAAGLFYAAGDIGTKAAVGGGWRLLFVPVLLACHGAAFVCLQLGFQRGSALATAGVATLLTNAVPIAGGILLFHEHLPGGALGVARVLAFAAVVAGAAALAKPEREALPT
jgi:drug/metabolite transporter (DMT)-like permease